MSDSNDPQQTPAGIDAVDRHGQLVTLPPDQAPQAFQDGAYRPATKEELGDFQEKKDFGGTGQAIITGLESAASVPTLGLSRELENSVFNNQAEQQARIRQNPIAKPIGTGVGILAGAINPFGEAGAAAEGAEGLASSAPSFGAADLVNPAGAVLKGGKLIKDSVSPFAEKAAGYLANPETSPLINSAIQGVIKGAIPGVAEGAAFGAGNAVDEHALGDPAPFGELLMANMGYGAVMGGGLGGLVSGAVSPLSKSFAESGQMLDGEKVDPGLMQKAVRKGISIFGGVSDKDQVAYLENPDAVNNAPGMEEIHAHANDFIQGLNDRVADNQTSVAEAKAEYAQFKADANQQFKQAGFDAKRASEAADMALAQAQEKVASETKSAALGQAPAVSNAVDQLQKHVFDQSSKSYDILDGSGKNINLAPVYEKGSGLVDELKSQGSIRAIKMAESLQEQLDSYKGQFGDSVPAAGAKRIIKGLDELSAWNGGADDVQSALRNRYRQLRYTLDSTLKDTVPEYKEAMAPLAEDTKLLKSLDKYGTSEDAANKIESLGRDKNYRNEMPVLKQLEERVGTNFTPELERYANPEANEALLNALPEFDRAQRTADIVEHLRNPETKAALQESLMKSPEYMRLQKMQAELEKALEERGQFKGLTQATLQGKLQQAMTGKNIEALRLISKLPDFQPGGRLAGEEGTKMVDVLKALRLKEAFEKGSVNGSRHVNLYAGVIGGLASLFGHVNPLAAIGSGAALGGAADRYGPQASKKILDMMSNSNPRISVLSKMEASANKTTSMGERAAKSIFTGAPDVAAALVKLAPQKIHEQMAASRDIKTNPYAEIEKTNDAVKHLQPYAPNISTAMASTAARASNYLGSLVPQAKQFAIQEKEKFSPSAMRAFEVAKHTIDNPVSVLDSVKNSTLSGDQMKAFVSVYPQLYNKFKANVVSELANHVNKGTDIPYTKRLSISKFLAQPADASMTQPAIAMNQMALSTAGLENQQAQQAGQKKKKSSKPLEIAGRAQTETQKDDYEP